MILAPRFRSIRRPIILPDFACSTTGPHVISNPGNISHWDRFSPRISSPPFRHGSSRQKHWRLIEPPNRIDRKSVVTGKSVSVRVDLGGRVYIKTKNTSIQKIETLIREDTMIN